MRQPEGGSCAHLFSTNPRDDQLGFTGALSGGLLTWNSAADLDQTFPITGLVVRATTRCEVTVLSLTGKKNIWLSETTITLEDEARVGPFTYDPEF